MVKNMTLKHEILKKLQENRNEEFTIKELSKILSKDYKNTYNAVTELKESTQKEKKANANFISFKPVITQETITTEIARKQELPKKIQLIYQDLKRIDNPLFIALLFGSYAKHKETKHSDIDICIITDNEELQKKVYSKIKIHPDTETHMFTTKEFRQMIKTKEFNVAHEITNSCIILHNIESFYELIKI